MTRRLARETAAPVPVIGARRPYNQGIVVDERFQTKCASDRLVFPRMIGLSTASAALAEAGCTEVIETIECGVKSRNRLVAPLARLAAGDEQGVKSLDQSALGV